MATYFSPNINTTGLILCIDAANAKSYPGSGTSWVDITGKNNPLTITGGTFNSGNSGSLVFNGGSASTPFNYASSITIDTWFNRTAAVNATHNMVCTITTPTGYPLFYISFKTDNTISLAWSRYVGATPTDSYLNTPTTYSNGVWYNVTVTLEQAVPGNTSIGRIYVNGVLITTLNSGTGTSDTAITSGNIEVANYNYGGTRYPFNGSIASIKAYSRALTATEIFGNYQAIKTRFGHLT